MKSLPPLLAAAALLLLAPGLARAVGEAGEAAAGRGLGGLATIAGERVVLGVPRGEEGRQGYRRLAAELDAAAAEMAPRVPLPPAALEALVTVVVEADHTAQALRTGRVGEAVAGGPADLHLVYHPDDLHAYRHALAGVLLARAGASRDLPPWLARGAALWLSGEWYGRPWREWLPRLAAAGALPSAAELLAAEEQGDASAPLWTPAAAAVVDALAGATLAEKLATTPGAPAVEALLRRIETQASAGARAAGPPGRPPVLPTPPEGFLRGVSLAMLNSVEGGYHAPTLDAQLERLDALGANAVSLMPFAYQPHPRRPEMRFLNHSPRSETDIGVLHAARRARGRGFRVLWKPHLWISHDSWPGEVEMESEDDWRRWWHGYRRYVLHHAFLAAWAGSEMFSVGVELDRTIHREDDWRRLIADVRRFYPGVVTYASNWHGGLDRVPFWDALDVLGVDAYYPLGGREAADDELILGARRVMEGLDAIARREGKPLLLTEVGFAARRGAWTSPHEEGGEYSEQDQAVAFRALLGALGRPPWLAGAFVWKVFSAETGRGDRPDFRFLGRPAEDEVRRWFTGAEPAAATPSGGGG